MLSTQLIREPTGKWVERANGLRYLRVGGRGQCLGAEKKLEARKILENAAESHTSGARFVRRSVHIIRTR